jgi:ATP-dependent DNA helicase RecG
MESTNDGFKISDEDLKIRGPGEFFGIRQSGFFKYKIANMLTDGPILRSARKAAFCLVEKDATLSHQEHNLIRDRLVNEYQEKLQKINIS